MAKKSGGKFSFSQISESLDKISKHVPIILEREDKIAPRISTGIYILNACLSGSIYGGVKSDAITVFAGPEATGKSFLAINICREAQRSGYFIIYIDTENSFSRPDFAKYGIDSSKTALELVKSNKVEEINFTITQLLDDLKTAKLEGDDMPKVIIVLDSLAQLASNKEKEDLLDGKLKQDMTKAKSIGSMFRSITMDLGYLDIPMIINNQTYLTMDMFPQEIMKGGKSLYYSASNITFLGKAKLKTGEEDEYDMQSGIIVTAKAVKNRQAKPKKVKFEIDFNSGCNPYVGLDMFCTEQHFDLIGIAKGKMEKLKVAKEVVDRSTGEVTYVSEEFKGGGNRWYVKHLGKSVSTKELFRSTVFTKEVLDTIEPIAQAYFKYNSVSEIEEEHKHEHLDNTDSDSDYSEDYFDNVEDMDVDDLM